MRRLIVCMALVATAAHSQTLLACKLVQGDMLGNCDISPLICNAAFQIDQIDKRVRMIDGLYRNVTIELEEWTDGMIRFKQHGQEQVTLTYSLNRLTGQLHRRSDYGEGRNRLEVWQCSPKTQLF